MKTARFNAYAEGIRDTTNCDLCVNCTLGQISQWLKRLQRGREIPTKIIIEPYRGKEE